MKLRLWHLPQVPSKKEEDFFRVDINTEEEAIRILKILWAYDNFQFDRKIKPDFINASGLEIYNEEKREWEEYYNDEGDDIVQIIENKYE